MTQADVDVLLLRATSEPADLIDERYALASEPVRKCAATTSGHLRDISQEASAGMADHATPVGTHDDLRSRSGSLHSVSAFRPGDHGPSTSQIIPDREALPHS
ncbi:hypothetical protein [Micromonospora viridifaciens]|uniref:hypothetical protein n=1 Tax=Micromonospora viridifaciens TaxID=1881 RepID=UPI001E3398A2|nr:hypothetical protein [Micromonospora viridifaciens]